MTLVITSTNWTALGYPILDRPAEYPYMAMDIMGNKLPMYDDGPSGMNIGDILMISLNSASYPINGVWYEVGTSGPDGKYLRLADEFVRAARYNEYVTTNWNSFSEVENEIERFERIDGSQIEGTDFVLKVYEGELVLRGKKLNNAKTEEIPLSGKSLVD